MSKTGAELERDGRVGWGGKEVGGDFFAWQDERLGHHDFVSIVCTKVYLLDKVT